MKNIFSKALTGFVLLFTLLFGAQGFAGGFAIGNGGDIVRCPIDSYYYTLDYVITRAQLNKVGKANVKTWRESLNRIQNLISQKMPTLSKSFSEFTQLLQNRTDFSKPYIWLAKTDLQDVNDEQYRSYSGCSSWGNKGEFYQVVIRNVVSQPSMPLQVVFQFDPEVFKFIENSALQHSYLVVHEWLWNIVKDAEQNRQLNWFIHSKLFDSYSPAQVQAYFAKNSKIVN